MKLGIVITRSDAEAVYNALRLALYSLQQGDKVSVFLSGEGVELDQIQDPRFDVVELAEQVLASGGRFLACGSCLKLRQAEASHVCPLSSLADYYELVRDSDKLVTV